jgi:hypothetical protein
MVRATQSIHKSHHVPDVPPRTAVSPRRVEVVVLVLAVSLCVLPLWLVKGAEPDVIAAVVVGHELALSAAISNGIRTAATGRRTHTARVGCENQNLNKSRSRRKVSHSEKKGVLYFCFFSLAETEVGVCTRSAQCMDMGARVHWRNRSVHVQARCSFYPLILVCLR